MEFRDTQERDILVKMEGIDEKSFLLHNQTLTARRLEQGWEVTHGERRAQERHLDQALARVLGGSPGSVLHLARAILEQPSGSTLEFGPPRRN